MLLRLVSQSSTTSRSLPPLITAEPLVSSTQPAKPRRSTRRSKQAKLGLDEVTQRLVPYVKNMLDEPPVTVQTKLSGFTTRRSAAPALSRQPSTRPSTEVLISSDDDESFAQFSNAMKRRNGNGQQ
ncbi:hypothetical protein H4R35_001815 [Dimargaris xerosporica]|nr:hypothetical protein H4R35_001815 [Dimargaris xerosporica]